MNSRNTQKSKIVDICLRTLVTCVKCDKPSLDGYEVENLISNNFVKKNKGFLVERFIKPPVVVTFQFKCSIRIHHIAIFCKVGAQKSSGIEILSQTSLNIDQYETIGSGVLPDSKAGFVFHRFDSNLEKFGDQYFFRTFKSPRHTSFVQNLKIKIFRTSGTSVPALGKVEIWGEPSKPIPQTCNNVVSTKEVDATNKMSNHKDIPIASTSIHSKSNWLRDIHKSSLRSGSTNQFLSGMDICSQPISIPEDFIDPITCEIMIQPLVMPSGKVIDNSTLETYQKAEQQWGRGPSDPFTGVPFSDSNKPLVATGLKTRIDKFLCDNSNHIELHNIPRTVGRSSSSLSHKLNGNVSKLISEQSSSCNLVNSHTQKHSNYLENKSGPKRRKLEVDIGSKSSLDQLPPVDMTHLKSFIDPLPRISQPFAAKSKITNSKPRKVNNFQERMNQSLELALKSTLSKLPKLTAEKQNNEDLKSAVCYNCNNCDNLFSIPCRHFVCRQCLINLKQKEFICSTCRSSFKSSDVHKVHL